MKDLYISMRISVDDSQDIQELKRLEHHAEFLLDLESYPEIKKVSDLNVVESGSTPENLLNAITAVCSNCKELSRDDSKACLNCPVKKLNALK